GTLGYGHQPTCRPQPFPGIMENTGLADGKYARLLEYILQIHPKILNSNLLSIVTDIAKQRLKELTTEELSRLSTELKNSKRPPEELQFNSWLSTILAHIEEEIKARTNSINVSVKNSL
ncbi:hypothetical protein HY570_00725, partial [Candidatus Micrarchaeota archaeon]|nr:hypothetical protein [Candidatus Micrarchaeota archaeon]